METKKDTYVCYTLTIEKERRYELINFFDEVFFDTDYQIMSDTVEEDVNEAYGAIYDGVLQDLADFSLRFYIEPSEQRLTDEKLKKLPTGVFTEIENIVFSEEAILNSYKEKFMLTNACEIIFDKKDIALRPNPVQIILQPKNAFGTGSHVSTQLAAQLLEKYTTKDDALVDVGTGTGILAIYAAKRGTQQVLAVDSDPLSIQEAAANIQENGVSSEIKVQQNNFLTGIDVTAFDVILANLSLNLYKQFLPEISQRVQPEQKFLFSGVIEAEREAFETLLTENDVTIVDKILESGWVAYYVQRDK